MLLAGPAGMGGALCIDPEAASFKKGIMKNNGIKNGRASEPYNKILVNHWRWLEARGYKQQATSCKLQAASLTRKLYNVIESYKVKEKVK